MELLQYETSGDLVESSGTLSAVDDHACPWRFLKPVEKRDQARGNIFQWKGNEAFSTSDLQITGGGVGEEGGVPSAPEGAATAAEYTRLKPPSASRAVAVRRQSAWQTLGAVI